MAHDAEHWGSPARWATWTDESLNKTLKSVAKGAHSLSFEKRVFERMDAILASTAGKRKRSTESLEMNGPHPPPSPPPSTLGSLCAHMQKV
eukprot:9822350-Alexandrium_andersonii.AAC.1